MVFGKYCPIGRLGNFSGVMISIKGGNPKTMLEQYNKKNSCKTKSKNSLLLLSFEK